MSDSSRLPVTGLVAHAVARTSTMVRDARRMTRRSPAAQLLRARLSNDKLLPSTRTSASFVIATFCCHEDTKPRRKPLGTRFFLLRDLGGFVAFVVAFFVGAFRGLTGSCGSGLEEGERLPEARHRGVRCR